MGDTTEPLEGAKPLARGAAASAATTMVRGMAENCIAVDVLDGYKSCSFGRYDDADRRWADGLKI